MKNPFLAGGFLVIVLTIASLGGYALHEKGLRLDAEAALAQSAIELEGAKKALLLSPKEVVKFVEVPAAMAAAVKTGVATPITAGKIAATSNVVEIPCPPPSNGGILMDSNTPPPKTNTPPTVPVTFGLTGEFFVAAIRHGSVQYTSTLRGTVFGEVNGASWHRDVPFAEENVRFDIVVSKDIVKAVEAYNQPWLKKHMKFACPTASVLYNPLDTVRPVNVGIGCGYGLVWF